LVRDNYPTSLGNRVKGSWFMWAYQKISNNFSKIFVPKIMRPTAYKLVSRFFGPVGNACPFSAGFFFQWGKTHVGRYVNQYGNFKNKGLLSRRRKFHL